MACEIKTDSQQLSWGFGKTGGRGFRVKIGAIRRPCKVGRSHGVYKVNSNPLRSAPPHHIAGKRLIQPSVFTLTTSSRAWWRYWSGSSALCDITNYTKC